MPTTLARSGHGPLGVVYLLHFSRPYQHARHYTGWTEDLLDRLDHHARGHGAPRVILLHHLTPRGDAS